jgi:hypothetical protein
VMFWSKRPRKEAIWGQMLGKLVVFELGRSAMDGPIWISDLRQGVVMAVTDCAVQIAGNWYPYYLVEFMGEPRSLAA